MMKCDCISSKCVREQLQNYGRRYPPETKFTRISILCLGVLIAAGMITDLEPMIVYGAKYSHQVTTATNDCANGPFVSGVICGNDQTIIDGDHNVATTNDVSSQLGSSSFNDDNEGDRGIHNEEPSDDQNLSNDDSTDTVADENDSQLPLGPEVLISDPTIRVFPCCDEMPAIV